MIFKTTIIYILYTVFCIVIFYYVALPEIIDRRAKDLGLLKYNSKVDKMEEKDSLHISGFDLYYLKRGTMEGYKKY